MGTTEEDTIQYRSRNGTPLLIYNWAGGGVYSIHGAYYSGTEQDGWIPKAWREDGRILENGHTPLDIDFEQVEIAA